MEQEIELQDLLLPIVARATVVLWLTALLQHLHVIRIQF